MMVSMTPDELRELIPSIRPDLRFEFSADGGLSAIETLPPLPGSMKRDFSFATPAEGVTMIVLTTSVDDAEGIDLEQLWEVANHTSYGWLSAIQTAVGKRQMTQMIEQEGGVAVTAHADVFGSYSIPRYEVLDLIQQAFSSGRAGVGGVGTWDEAAGCLSLDSGDVSDGMVRRIWLTPAADGGTAFESHAEVRGVLPSSIAESDAEELISSRLLHSMMAFHQSLAPMELAPEEAGRSCPQAALDARRAASPVDAPEPKSDPAPPRAARPVPAHHRRPVARSSRAADWIGGL